MPNIALTKAFFNETLAMPLNPTPVKPIKVNAVIGTLLLAFCHSAQATVQDLLAADTVVQNLKLFNTPTANSFSRADATVLLDRLLIRTASDFNKNMADYLNPFGDVNPDSAYYASLMHLAYYRGSDTETVVTRENNLFRPLDYVTRQEFLKMAMQGFNIPVSNTNNLARFNDEQNMAIWAVKYFSTAVAQGIIVGDATGNLNPKQNLTTYEALLILDRIVAKYAKAYLHNGTGFDVFSAVDLDKVLANTLGEEREPLNYINTATPIKITNIVVETPLAGRCGADAKVLRVVSAVDATTGKAVPYYWWTTSDGYLGKYQDAAGETAGAALQKVCFYPATTAVNNYRVTVGGADNLGFTDSYQKILPTTTFAATNATHNTATMVLAVAQPASGITAGSVVALDLTGSQSKEGGVNVALEQVDVAFTIGTQIIPLFAGNPEGGKINFSVPTLEKLYGKIGTLTVSAHTQTAAQSKSFSNIRYLPKYEVKGQVFNSGAGTAATSVKVDTATIALDANREFGIQLAGDVNNQLFTVDALGGNEQNAFTSYPVTLSYQTPTAYVALIGENRLTKDTDGDGMLDKWEQLYGLNVYDPADAALDLDKDGFTNLAEFKGLSSPTDAASKPLVIKATAGDRQVTLQWAAVAGASNYGVCYATEAIADINNCLNYADGAWLDTTKTTLKVGSLSNGKKYYFRAVAENATGPLRVSAVVTATPKFLSALNDTGITDCADGSSNNLQCPVADYPNQDAESGRDVTQNNDSDGHAGFSFTKISSTGAVLPVSAISWNCVKDNVTGLIWEIKTDDGSLHDKDWTYSWYEPDSTKNGGFAGYQNKGGLGCGNTSICNSDEYIKAVNIVGWCGFKDWRLPRVDELIGITNLGNYNSAVDMALGRYHPIIDSNYFPNTVVNNSFLSSSPYANQTSYVWSVDFQDGGNNYGSKNNSYAIRLVRNTQ